jgi:sn-glycerol 3-phosphate transport system permease protein
MATDHLPSAPAFGPLRVRLHGLRSRGKPYLLLAPSLVFLAAFTYWPVGWVAFDSLFLRRLGDRTGSFVGLGNYLRLVGDPKFVAAATNNLIYAVGTVLPSIALALAFALMVQRSSLFNTVIRSLLFFPTLIPLVAAAALWSFIFLPNVGLIDYYLGGFLPMTGNWLGDPDTALAAVMAITVWKNAGYYMIFYLAALQAIPEETIEAAILDGAGALQRLRYILLPLLKPTTAFVMVIALIQVVTTIDHVIVLTRGGPTDATQLLLYYIYQTASELHDTGKAAAATVLTLAGLLAVSLFGIRTLERGAANVA